jgi:crossover junction endodeoxyribonuclease RuvC
MKQSNNLTMRILGIDPGLGSCGWGVLENDGGKTTALAFGCLSTTKSSEVSIRLAELFDQVTDLLKSYHPNILVLEDLFFNTNAKTVITIGEARGVIMLAAQKQKIPVLSYPPLEIKMAITGYGRAEKGQVQKMVKNILHLEAVPRPDDTADALAVGLTYCLANRFKSKIRAR